MATLNLQSRSCCQLLQPVAAPCYSCEDRCCFCGLLGLRAKCCALCAVSHVLRAVCCVLRGDT